MTKKSFIKLVLLSTSWWNEQKIFQTKISFQLFSLKRLIRIKTAARHKNFSKKLRKSLSQISGISQNSTKLNSFRLELGMV